MTGTFIANPAVCGQAAGRGVCAGARKQNFTSTWTRIGLRTMNAGNESEPLMRRRLALSTCAVVASAAPSDWRACSSRRDKAARPTAASRQPARCPAAAARPGSASAATIRANEQDKSPRCGGMSTQPRSRAYRFVGRQHRNRGRRPVIVRATSRVRAAARCSASEFSGGADGTYKFVRTPKHPGRSWKAGGAGHRVRRMTAGTSPAR